MMAFIPKKKKRNKINFKVAYICLNIYTPTIYVTVQVVCFPSYSFQHKPSPHLNWGTYFAETPHLPSATVKEIEKTFWSWK